MSGAVRAASCDSEFGVTNAGSGASEGRDTNRIMRRPANQRNPKRASDQATNAPTQARLYGRKEGAFSRPPCPFAPTSDVRSTCREPKRTLPERSSLKPRFSGFGKVPGFGVLTRLGDYTRVFLKREVISALSNLTFQRRIGQIDESDRKRLIPVVDLNNGRRQNCSEESRQKEENHRHRQNRRQRRGFFLSQRHSESRLSWLRTRSAAPSGVLYFSDCDSTVMSERMDSNPVLKPRFSNAVRRSASTRNHCSAKHGLRRFWWTLDLVQTKGRALWL